MRNFGYLRKLNKNREDVRSDREDLRKPRRRREATKCNRTIHRRKPRRRREENREGNREAAKRFTDETNDRQKGTAGEGENEREARVLSSEKKKKSFAIEEKQQIENWLRKVFLINFF